MIKKFVWACLLVGAAMLSSCASTGRAPEGFSLPTCAKPAAVSCNRHEPDAKRFGHASLS